MFFRSKKIISMLIVFVIVFTYMGQTLEAVATTDGLSAITNGFFKAEEMELNGYFKQAEQQSKEKISNVNEKATLILEISPNEIGKGFLKKGSIMANVLEGKKSNFKFSKIKNVSIHELEQEVKYEGEHTKTETEESTEFENKVIEENQITNTENKEQNVTEDNTVEKNEVNHTTVESTTIKNEISNENVTNETVQNKININTTENIELENNTIENTTNSNKVSIMNDTTNETSNEITNKVTSRSSEPRTADEIQNQGQLINEEQVIENLKETIGESYEELTAKDFEIEIVEDNQIKVENVIYHTTIEVEIEYNKKEELEIADLYQEINLTLNGTYINVDLEKIEVETQNNIFVGWSYHKEFELTGEYTKFSPFKLGEHTGSIVENKIIVKRETEEEKYLPVKQTIIEIEVPDWNGNAPETVNVQATKLMATRGEDVGEVTFGKENWEYNAENKKIIIDVQNENDGKAIEAMGEDEFVIVYRYRDYTEDEFVNMANNFKVTIEEYSANKNSMTSKEFHNSQQIKTQVNDLITYNIGSTEEKINKAKVNANYASGTENYETEFTTSVNVNILTSDLLEELKINSSKEGYISNNSVEVDATPDVYYNKVKFNYTEIKNLLQNGTTIEIQNLSGQLLYALNNELVVNQEACEVRLESKEKGVFVVFKNIANNGNIGIEFTKAIGKSTYEQATFNSFEEIKSYISAELKYQNYDERYAMSEIVTSKKLQNSQTKAELVLTNNNLSTIAKNDGVEVRIVLNNDKLNTDVYKNPSFELVFPKYVTDVNVENIGLIYGCGLKIANFKTYQEDGFVKMKIETTGVQTAFSESVITNGTNIILNLNLTLEEYTPKKQDQIKLYYCNEAVTNYTAQTKWMMNTSIPNGILKETNGFDVAVVNYQAPNGLITSNAIVNYDGHGSKIKSIGQGEKTAKIEAGKPSQMATMELVAMNNTGNKCSEAVFLGRIPFKGNKSVITGKDLETTETVKLLSGIKESKTNENMTTIYYSENEKATQNLKDSTNGWMTNVKNWQGIKSYMIVVEGELASGTVLKYNYDFEIPEHLDYQASISGSFGGYYNNQYSSVVAYENTEANKVSLITEVEQTVNQVNNEPDSNPPTTQEIPDVEVTQFISGNEFNYHDTFEYRVTIQNKSNIETYISIDNDLPDNLFLRKTIMSIDGKEKEIESYNKFSKYEKLTANGKIELVATGEVMDWGNLNKDLDLSNIVIVSLMKKEIKSNEIQVKVHKNPEIEEEDLEEEDSEKCSISGNVYVDAGENEVKTDEDNNIKSQVQVQLLKGSNMVKATTTDSAGNYAFSKLEPGDYSLVYHYDKDNYKATQYVKEETNEVSKAIETEEGISVTDNIALTDGSVSNVNMGLQEKDKFDFAIKQYVESAIINIKGEETEYNYDNLELAKIEISPSDLKKATVKLKYKIIVTNVGNTEGQVTSIVDYIPNGLIFNQAENIDWSIGVIPGNIYYDGLKDINLLPGESKEISLILNKNMTEENTGIISNKVQIAYTESDTRLTESLEGNFATQETIVTITQGAHTGLKLMISTVSFTGIIALFGFMVKTGRLEKKFNGKKWIKKVYK